MKYVFFGTPEFAEIILRKLISAGMVPSVLVCNPDRPVGRDKVMTPPLTKQLVEKRGLNVRVFQPSTKEELVSMSDEIFNDVDFGVIAAYSQIIPKEVIDKAKMGLIGVHPSLLPKYRGATPIQSAILGGDEETGTTLFLIDEKVDNGPILASAVVEVSGSNYEELVKRLTKVSGDLLADVLPDFYERKVDAIEQDHSLATLTKKFSTEDAYIKPEDLAAAEGGNKSKAVEILRKIRAFNPEPGTYTIINDKRTKLLGASIDGDKLVLKRIQREGKTPIDL